MNTGCDGPPGDSPAGATRGPTAKPCDACGGDDRSRAQRAKTAERHGRVAVVAGVPMEECPACGSRWFDVHTAEALDGILRTILGDGAG